MKLTTTTLYIVAKKTLSTPPLAKRRAGAEPGAGWSRVRFSIGFIGSLVPAPALPSMRSFFQRYYLSKPPDLMRHD